MDKLREKKKKDVTKLLLMMSDAEKMQERLIGDEPSEILQVYGMNFKHSNNFIILLIINVLRIINID